MRVTAFLGAAVAVAAIASACGSNNFGPGSGDGGSDALFGSDVAFGDGSPQPGDGAPKPTTCDGSCAAAGGTCKAGVCTLVDNAGNVPASTQTQLEGGGSADSAFAYVYPYDKTVWARGLLSATMQFGGTPISNAYVHISCSTLDYQGFFGPSSPGRVALSQTMWDAVMGAVASSKDPVKVEVTKDSGGAISGPITETWYVAQGSLRGTIYYETYGSPLAGGAGSVGIMKIQPGTTTPAVVKSGCGNVCHTASADGSTLVANVSLGFSSASYDLKNNAATILMAGSEIFTYGGIYPDGSFVVSATNYRTWFPGEVSRVYDTKSGAQIPTPSWDSAVQNGGTPAFSPDGTKLAFIHEDKDGGHTLSVMDYDKNTKSFSPLTDIVTTQAGFVAWPAFTPDSKYVVYHVGSNEQFETDSGATGDVYAVDLATKTPHRLDSLDGYSGSGTYLPANDPNMSFAPTVLPEAVGGYFWVVFTSHRSYGNTLPSQDNGDQNGKLWVAALDISAAAGTDGSHPAFFLDGQEHESDNLRGFWVLDPCKADGQTCGSGDECCGGYCRGDDGGPLVCVPPPGGCSQVYEKCTTSADCCETTNQCINGKCAVTVN
ncbi:MAG TPA: hypothetical protein VGH28_14730 [Polyangiaceae bacterium]